MMSDLEGLVPVSLVLEVLGALSTLKASGVAEVSASIAQ